MKIKKAKKVCVALFSMIFLLCACENKPETNYPEPKKNTPVSIAEKGLKIEPDKGLEIVKNTADFVEVKENQEYNFETDNQNIPHGLMHEDCLETEDSYYFLRCASIYTFDKTAKTYSWLCNKPDCSHFGSHTCNAFFPYDCEAMDYYEGNIYVLIRESSELAEEEKNEGLWKETLELYRMSLDGSSRTRVCTIATAIARKGMDDNIFSLRYAEIHRGYLYYIYTYGIGEGEDSFYANNSNTLYRIALDGKSEKECICTIEYGGLASGINPYFQGSYMYFIKADFNHEGTGYGDLYRLNTESMKLEYMDIKNVTNFIISGDEIIYRIRTGKILFL